MGSIFTFSILQSALELGCIYSLVALALFVSFSILNIADLSTDGCFTLGCARLRDGHDFRSSDPCAVCGNALRGLFRICHGIFTDKAGN